MDIIEEETTDASWDCEKKGHCLYEGTSKGEVNWCCKCKEYIDVRTIAEKLGFYEGSVYLPFYNAVEQGLTDIAHGRVKWNLTY